MTTPRDGLLVSVDGRHFECDVENITWQTISPVRPGSDQGAGAGEQALNTDAVWRRTRHNWILGAGQEFADVIEESDVRRFNTSDGIDPWTIRCLVPLPVVESKRSSANTNLRLLLARVGSTDYLELLDGNTALYTSNPESSPPTWTAHTGTAGTLTSMASDGRRVWIASGADIYLATPGTAAVSVFSTFDATLVGYANGRLLAANGAQLVEIDAAGTPTTLYTHPNSNFVWDGIVSSPSGIYVFGTSGVSSQIFVITAVDTTGALDIPFVAGEMPDGEFLRVMAFYGGVMVMGTSRGIRLALITGGGFLSYGPVIETPGDVRCLEPQGEDVWFGWTRSSSVNGLGRTRLSRFTADLVSSFASDLMARGTVSGNVTAAATYGTRRYFAIAGRGVYGEMTALEPVTTIEYGTFDYGVSEPKVFDSLTVWCDALPAGCSIVTDVFADDNGTALVTLTMNTTGQRKETIGYSGTVEAERLRVVTTINQSGSTPVAIRRITVRAVPKPFINETIILPLYLSDVVRADAGFEIGQIPLDEFTFLTDLVKSRTRFTLTVGDYSTTARLIAVDVQQGGLGGGNGLEGWSDDRKFVAGKWQASFMTAEPTS